MRTAEHVLLLRDLRVHTDTVTFDLVALRRPSGAGPVGTAEPNPARDLLSGSGRKSMRRATPPRPPSWDLLVGVVLPDGRSAATSVWGRADAPADTDRVAGLRLDCLPNGAGDGGLIATVLLSPVPPEGRTTLVVSAPAIGVGRTITLLDGMTLQRARAKALPLWPA